MFGHRAIDHDGWRAVCPWPGPSFSEASKPFGALISAGELGDLDANHWELYHITEDIAETVDLAHERRDKLIEMIALWYIEAGKYGVFPIDSGVLERIGVERPQIAEARDRYVLRPNTQTVPFFAGPRVLNRPHSISAEVDIPSGGAEGVLVCQGSAVGGWSLYMQDGRLHYVHNYVRRALYQVSTPDPVPPGKHELRFEFEPTGLPDIAAGRGTPGHAQLYIDGTLVSQIEMPTTTPLIFNPGGLSCGANPGSAITPAYRSPFRFSGGLQTVTIDLSGELITDSESEMRLAMARQ
jgi:arylsulfatase